MENGVMVSDLGARSISSNKLICAVVPIRAFQSLQLIGQNANNSANVYSRREHPLNARMRKFEASSRFRSAETPSVKWSRILFRDRMTDVRGTIIHRSTGQRTLLDEIPVMAHMETRTITVGSGINRQRALETKLTFRDLKTGNEIGSQILNDNPKILRMAGKNDVFPFHSPIKAVGDQIVCFSGEEIYFVDIPDKVKKGVQEPLRLMYPENGILDLAKDSEFQIPCNQKDGLTFELESSFREIKLDELTGKIKFKTDAIVQYAERTARNTSKQSQWYKAAIKQWNIPSDRLPLNLPLTITVINHDGEFDTIQYNLILLVDKAPIDVAAKKLERRQKFRQGFYRQIWYWAYFLENRYLEYRQQLAIEGAGKGETDERLERLRARLRSLQRSLQRMEFKLERRGLGKPKGKNGKQEKKSRKSRAIE